MIEVNKAEPARVNFAAVCYDCAIMKTKRKIEINDASFAAAKLRRVIPEEAKIPANLVLELFRRKIQPEQIVR
jgi:hypothetical protein